jgi:4-amino-4-deoxy-L-arabinose transferase-like glycosyltransferase
MSRINFFLKKYFPKIKTHILLLVLIIFLAAFFRFDGLCDRDIWYDEALTVVQSEKSIMQISHDVPTPIHYYFVHFFLFFGKGTFLLGFPSVICGLLSVFVIFKIGEKIGGTKIGIIAAFLLAISPMHIEFSQQILHYSYFVFFTLLSLLFYIKLLSSFKNNNIEYSNFWWLIAINLLNILTHISALLIVVMEVIFFIFFILIFKRHYIKKFKKSFLFVFFIIIPFSLIVLKFGNNYYIDLFKNLVNYGSSKSIELGYSLSKQLGVSTLTFNKEFFLAMFSWFGFGKGWRLFVLLFFFFFGVGSMIKKKKFIFLSFLLFLTIYPFVQLYFIRPIHWFEEKYFIFIIPVYFIIISCGILGMYESLLFIGKKTIARGRINKTNVFYYIYILIIFIGIFLMSLTPIKSRQTYGFPLEEITNYSWKKVYNYLINNTNQEDRFFVRNSEGAFFDFYFSKDEKNKTWFEEGYLFKLNSDEFIEFISEPGNNYFISIPDVEDIFLSGSLKREDNKKVGGFNISKFKWRKEDFLTIKKDEENRWQYYDDFKNSKFLSDAYSWKNFALSYSGNFNLPLTYGYNDLVPTGSGHCDIVYRFDSSELEKKDLYFKPLFSIDNKAVFSVYLGHNQDNLEKIFEKKSDIFSYFNPSIKLPLEEGKNNFFIKISYNASDVNSDYQNISAKNKIKSLLIYDSKNFKTPRYSIVGDKIIEEKYDSELEYVKSEKWKKDTIKKDGWIQAEDGILYNPNNFGNDNALIYKIGLKKIAESGQLEIKSFTLDNKLNLLYSKDGNTWSQLDEINSANIYTSSYQMENLNSKDVMFKFYCEKAGPSCQLRNLEFAVEKDISNNEKNSLEYQYDSELETKKSNKWIYDTIQSDGWIQADDGILFTRDEDVNFVDDCLVYNFDFEKTVEDFKITTKTFTFDNEISIYSSIDGENWLLEEKIINSDMNTNNILVKDAMSKKLRLKFECEKKGPTCQLRNLSFKASVAKINE